MNQEKRSAFACWFMPPTSDEIVWFDLELRNLQPAHLDIQNAHLARWGHQDGYQCRCETFKGNEISSWIQSEGWYAEGQCRGDEKVSLVLSSRTNTDHALCHRWIAGKISEILGNEDDVVIELCFNLIEAGRYVCYAVLLNTHRANRCL